MDYRVMVDLVAELPNLEYWGRRTGGDEWSTKTEQEATQYLSHDWAGPRRDTRQNFGKGLLSAHLPKSLQQARLDFLHDLEESTNIGHLTAQPDLTSPMTKEFFSISLSHHSDHLRRLHLRVVADEALFLSDSSSNASWPNLESLVVMFHMVNPSGQWYFLGPDGEGRDTKAIEVTNASYPPLKTTACDEEMDFQIESEGVRRYRGSLTLHYDHSLHLSPKQHQK